ncbi:MAG: hypothetical protein LBT46_01055 [Planctomycetaceae bacterium]|jgi:hypothetical protein|nr:hypothetical protein [Planctomycetaceae bacterium]
MPTVPNETFFSFGTMDVETLIGLVLMPTRLDAETVELGMAVAVLSILGAINGTILAWVATSLFSGSPPNEE